MLKFTSNKSNFIFTLLLAGIILFYQYIANLFPFSEYITLDLASNAKLATFNFLRFDSTYWTHENYYPRLFLLPFFVLYKLFNLSIGIVEFLMFFTMIFLLIISGYFISHKLGGHSVGLVLVPLLVVNGSFSNVAGIFFLLFLIENPTVLRVLILSLGYPHLVVFALPYLYLLKKKILVFLGSFLIVIQLSITRSTQHFFFAWTGFDPSIRGFNIYLFMGIEIVFFIYFIFALTKRDKKSYSTLILPLTTLLVALILILGRAHFYWIVKTLILFPLFVTISAKGQKKE